MYYITKHITKAIPWFNNWIFDFLIIIIKRKS